MIAFLLVIYHLPCFVSFIINKIQQCKTTQYKVFNLAAKLTKAKDNLKHIYFKGFLNLDLLSYANVNYDLFSNSILKVINKNAASKNIKFNRKKTG